MHPSPVGDLYVKKLTSVCAATFPAPHLLSEAYLEAMRLKGAEEGPSQKQKTGEYERRSHYRPEFEAFSKEWCLGHLRKDYFTRASFKPKSERILRAQGSPSPLLPLIHVFVADVW